MAKHAALEGLNRRRLTKKGHRKKNKKKSPVNLKKLV